MPLGTNPSVGAVPCRRLQVSEDNVCVVHGVLLPSSWQEQHTFNVQRHGQEEQDKVHHGGGLTKGAQRRGGAQPGGLTQRGGLNPGSQRWEGAQPGRSCQRGGPTAHFDGGGGGHKTSVHGGGALWLWVAAAVSVAVQRRVARHRGRMWKVYVVAHPASLAHDLNQVQPARLALTAPLLPASPNPRQLHVVRQTNPTHVGL